MKNSSESPNSTPEGNNATVVPKEKTFFPSNAPFSGSTLAIIGYSSLLLLVPAILQLILPTFFPYDCERILSSAFFQKAKTDMVGGIFFNGFTTSYRLFFLPFAFFIYLVSIFIHIWGCYLLVNQGSHSIPRKTHIGATILGILWPLSPLLPFLMKNVAKRGKVICLSITSLCITAIMLWGFFTGSLGGLTLLLLAWLQCVLFALLMSSLPEKQTIRWIIALAPSLLSALITFGFLIPIMGCFYKSSQCFATIEEYAGMPLDIKSIQERSQKGMSLDDFKDDATAFQNWFCKSFWPRNYGDYDYSEKALSEEKVYLQKCDRFLQVQPQILLCNKNRYGRRLGLIDNSHPQDLSYFTWMKHFFSFLIKKDFDNIEKVEDYNSKMLRLREWMLVNAKQHKDYLNKAISIDAERREALLKALAASKEITPEKFSELLGESPDWSSYYSAYIGLDTAEDYAWLQMKRRRLFSFMISSNLKLYANFQQVFPLLEACHFEQKSLKELQKQVNDIESFRLGFPKTSSSTWYNLADTINKTSQDYSAARIAAKIIGFHKKNNKYPDNLAQAGVDEAETHSYSFMVFLPNEDSEPGVMIKLSSNPRYSLFVEYPLINGDTQKEDNIMP